jgi:hypothetical protein
MQQFVPSQVRDYMDVRFPFAKAQLAGGQGSELPPDYAGALAHLIRMLDGIPDHLMVLRGEADAELGESVEAVRMVVDCWRAGNRTQLLKPLVGRNGWSPLTFIRKHIDSLPDEGPRPGTAALTIVRDPALREVLLTDLSSARDAFDRAAWKAATVLSGSVAEALLLYVVAARPEEAQRAAEECGLTVKTDIQRWDLHQLTAVAIRLNLISDTTARQCEIAKDFRNLIHPGRALRLSLNCDRGTAHAAAAAVELVIRDLERRCITRMLKLTRPSVAALPQVLAA